MNKNHVKVHVGIIGCGCSGLVALKELLDEGHQCTVFEKSNSIGGVYTQAYQQGELVSSHLLTMFSDFIGNDDSALEKPRMLSFIEYSEYLNDYAEHFRLKQFVKLQTEVKSVWKDHSENKWKVLVSNGLEQIYTFDRLAICTGVYANENMPTFKNQCLFQGKIKHFKQVQLYEEFIDKKICIVGSGESASDMILAAAKFGKKAFLSIRNDHGFIVPRYIHGDRFGPADLDTSRVHHSIPRAWGVLHTYIDMINSLVKSYLKCLIYQGGKSNDYDKVRRAGIYMNLKQIKTSNIWNTFGTKNANIVEALVKYSDTCCRKPGIKELKANSIVFEDNSEEYVDEIICCTGFRNSFPYIEESDRADQNLKRIAKEAKVSHNLYKHCLHPDLADEICWIGFARPALGAIPPLIELQARWFALLCSNKLKLPMKFDMLKQISKYVKYLEWQLTVYRVTRLTGLTDNLIYADDLARTIGCRPNFTRIFFTEPKLWLKLMCGPLINAHYRLTGPHAKPKQAKQIILKAKWVMQPNVLYSIMLMCYSFFWLVFGIESCKPASWYPL
ncbi:unnamed protein product [Rotaria socialis]